MSHILVLDHRHPWTGSWGKGSKKEAKWNCLTAANDEMHIFKSTNKTI